MYTIIYIYIYIIIYNNIFTHLDLEFIINYIQVTLSKVEEE